MQIKYKNLFSKFIYYIVSATTLISVVFFPSANECCVENKDVQIGYTNSEVTEITDKKDLDLASKYLVEESKTPLETDNESNADYIIETPAPIVTVDPTIVPTPTPIPTVAPTAIHQPTPVPTVTPTPKPVTQVQKALNNSIKNSGVPSNASVRAAVISLDTGEEAYHRDLEMKTPVSTIKVLFMLFFLEDVAEGKRDLSGKRVLKEEDKWTSSGKVAGTGIMQDEPNGTEYTWWEVIELMMIESDNVATNIIISELGIKNIQNRIASMGLKNTNFLGLIFDRKATVSSAKDMAMVLDVLYKKSTEDAVYKKGLDLMKIQRYRGRISSFIPQLTVHHKTGQQSNCVADIGYVFYDDNKPPVMMAIFIDGVLKISADYAEYGDVIGNISRDMMEYFQN